MSILLMEVCPCPDKGEANQILEFHDLSLARGLSLSGLFPSIRTLEMMHHQLVYWTGSAKSKCSPVASSFSFCSELLVTTTNRSLDKYCVYGVLSLCCWTCCIV